MWCVCGECVRVVCVSGWCVCGVYVVYMWGVC